MVKTWICPSLLGTDEKNTREWVEKLDGNVDAFHVDVMDNQFVPNYTLDRFAPPFISQLRTVSEKHVHLMTEIPSKYYNAYFEAGATLLVFHHEAVKNPIIDLNAIHSFGLKAGVALKPKTPADVLKDYIHNVDLVLVMTVEPGFGGQSFMSDMLEKIRDIREAHPALDIMVDGGINLQTAKTCLDAGANMLVAGHGIFNSKNVMHTVKQFNALKE